MKKILLISIALFTTLSMNAQVEKLIYEMDWAGVEYNEWNYFVGEAPNASYYKATDEGLAITNPSVTDQIWQVRVINRSSEDHGLSLDEGHDYVVRLTLKVPSDGHIFMQLGALYSSWYDGASVKASDDWQVIDIENQCFYSDISNAHVLLGLGEMVGTTILKKVQVYEVLGSSAQNDMYYMDLFMDGINGSIGYKLLKAQHKAMLTEWSIPEEEVNIPSEVSYEGEVYTVMSISKDAFRFADHVTKITVPKTIRSMDLDYDGVIYANPFCECKSLEWIEVEDGCPLFSSVDGVLFAENKTMLLGYPIASPRETYTVPKGVTNIRSDAFVHNKYLRKLVIPEEVTYLGWHLFDDTKSLEELYIKGVLEPECMSTLFESMDTKVTVYVQPSEVYKFKAIYKGPVYPLPEQIFDDIPYRPFVEEGKVWKVGEITSGDPIQLVEYLYFEGDTIIDGKTCKQMMCQWYGNPYNAVSHNISQEPSLSYVGAWYEENKKVYEYDTTNKQFKMMYDFSLEDNGTFQINDLPYVYVVGPRQSGGIKGFKGVYRDVWVLRDGRNVYCNAPWLEGVGGIYIPTISVIEGNLAGIGRPVWVLMACAVGDELVYFNDAFEDGATPAEARKQRIDFTHIIKEKPKTRNVNEEEQSLYGNYNEQQLSINLNPINDVYMVSITDESGKAVYEKAINAGNIVGLNIDISKYAMGNYTVTIDNSNESFIGEFKAQTTGMKEVIMKKDTRMSIYNLQGQRLNSLQKGLNIVNGQKVYVK